MRFSYLTLQADESQLDFARDWCIQVIGLSKVWQSDDFVLIEGDEGAGLGLHRGRPLTEPEKVQIHFEVPDVDQAYERIASQGANFSHGPADTPWGYRLVTLRDPVDHTVELFADMAKAGGGSDGG